MVEILNTLKEFSEKNDKLQKQGVYIYEATSKLEECLLESISHIITKDEKKHKEINDLVGWWAYEKVDKIMYEVNGEKTDLEKPEDFIAYLIKEYGEN